MTTPLYKHTTRPLFVAVFILIISALLARHTQKPELVQPAYAQCTGTHDIKIIDTGVSSSSSYAIDMENGSDSRPFISYFKSALMRSAKCSSGTCASSTFATPGNGQAGGGSAVANYGVTTYLEGNNPFIIYFTNASGSEEKFVTCNNSACTSTSTTSDGADNRNHVSSFRTSDGTPYLLNGVSNSGQISARRCTNVGCNPSNWLQFGTFLSGASQASRPIPLLSSSGNPISVYERNGDLQVYTCSDSGCSGGSQNTVVNGGVGSYMSAMLKNGLPLIAYVRNGGVQLLFCGNWSCSSGNTTRTIDASGATGQVSVAVGSDGIPVLSYFKGGSTADLYMARCNNSTCSGTPTRTRIYTGGVSNQNTVIGLRSGNIPGILFRDGSANLKYVACTDQVCTPDTSGCVTPTPTYGPTAKPSNIQVREDDATQGSIIQTYNVYISWAPPAFAGFASGPNRYHVYISDSPTFSSNVVDVVRAKTVPWYTTRGDTAAIAKVKQNQQYYVRICADYDDGAGGWNQQCATDISYTKLPYAQATFSGATDQRVVSVSSAASCASGVPNRFMGTLSMTPNTNGYSSSCSTTPSGSKVTNFSCTITYDNINYDPDPRQQFTLAMSGGSSVYGCGGTCTTPGSCANIFSPNVDANQTTTTSGSQPLFVNTDLAASFFKVKNMSVYTSAGINSPFPAGHLPFDSNDTGDNYFDQGSTGTNTGVGVVMSNGTQTAGLSSAPNNGISARGWRSNTYSSSATKYVGNGFIAFAKGQKQVQTINSLSDSAFTSASSGIFLVSGNLTLNNSNISALNNKYVILMSEGTIRISNNLTPANGNVALFAQTIHIDDAVNTVNAILSANTMYLATTSSSTSTTALSIVGSLSAKTPIDMTRRARDDNDLQPSVFIQADPGAYLNLAPHLSTVKTEYLLLQ